MAKLGFEVEGRMRDEEVLTLFVNTHELLYTGWAKIAQENRFGLFKQIYISDLDNIFDLTEESCNHVGGLFYNMLSNCPTITVCVTELEKAPSNQLSVVLIATAKGSEFLNDLHAIKIEQPDGGVLVFETKNGVLTDPEDFEGDMLLKLADE